MKKFTLIAVVLFYSIATFGVSLNYFYCCGKLKEVSIQINPPVPHYCTMNGDEDCCKNEKVDLKISADQNISQPVTFEPGFLADALIDENFEVAKQLLSQQCGKQVQSRPPPLSFPHLHVLNCSFLI